MTLPLLLYAAASAYRSSEDAKQREADKQERIDLANTVYSYGTVLDDAGSPMGGIVQFDVNKHTNDRFRFTHNKFGINGTVEPIKQGDSIEQGFTVLTPGFGKQAVRKNQLFTPAGDILPALLEKGVKSEDIIQTGQFINNEYKSFPDNYLKYVMPKEDAVVQTKTTKLRYFSPENPQIEHMNTEDARAYAQMEGFDPDGIQQKLITELVSGDKQETTFTISAIAKATDAANKADKPPLFAFSYTGEKPSYGFSLPGTNFTQTPAVMSAFATDIGKLGLRTYEDLENAGVDMESYKAMLRNAAGSLLNAHSQPVGDTGKTRLDVAIKRNSDVFLQNQYLDLFRLPGFAIAFRDAKDGTVSELFAEAKLRANEQGNDVRVGVLNNADDDQIPEEEELVVAAVETPEIKAPNDMFVDYLVSNKLMEPEKANSWVVQNITNYKEGSISELAEDQSKSRFLNYLFTEKVQGSDLRGIDLFASATAKTTEPLTQLENTVMKKFVAEYGSIDDMANFMIAMNPRYSGTNIAGYMYEVYAGGDAISADAESFFEQNRAVAVAFGNADRFLSGAIDSYQLSDGSITKLGAQAGEIALGFDGFFYMVDSVILPAAEAVLQDIPVLGNLVKKLKGGDGQVLTGSVEQKYAQLKNAAMGGTGQVERYADMTRAAKEKYLRDRGYAGTVEDFDREEAEARRVLEEEFNAMSRELVPQRDDNDRFVANLDEEINLKYAMRAYYRYMAAYALASATQGGTGGRTISDQDVLNFLKAMQTNSLLSNPKTEMRVLQVIRAEARQQKKIAEMLATGGPTAIATMKILRTEGSNKVGLDMNQLAVKVLSGNVGNVSDNGKGAKPEVAGPTEAEILERRNSKARENGDPEVDVINKETDIYYADAVAELNEERKSQ